MCRKPRRRKPDDDDEEAEEKEEEGDWPDRPQPILKEPNAMEKVRDKMLVRALAAEINARLQAYRDRLRFV